MGFACLSLMLSSDRKVKYGTYPQRSRDEKLKFKYLPHISLQEVSPPTPTQAACGSYLIFRKVQILASSEATQAIFISTGV